MPAAQVHLEGWVGLLLAEFPPPPLLHQYACGCKVQLRRAKPHDEVLENVIAASTVATLWPEMCRKMGSCVLALISLCLCLGPAQGFYLPGVAPQDYAKACHCVEYACIALYMLGFSRTDRTLCLALQGDKVVLKVNKLTSTKTQLPYEYYSMPYCRPEKIMPSAENLG